MKSLTIITDLDVGQALRELEAEGIKPTRMATVKRALNIAEQRDEPKPNPEPQTQPEPQL